MTNSRPEPGKIYVYTGPKGNLTMRYVILAANEMISGDWYVDLVSVGTRKIWRSSRFNPDAGSVAFDEPTDEETALFAAVQIAPHLFKEGHL